MTEFRYKAKTAAGKIISGVLEAEDIVKLRQTVRDQGLFLLSANQSQSRADPLAGIFKPKFTSKDLAVFCKQISSMLTAGVTLIRALDILYQQSEKKNLKTSVQKLYEDVQKGDMFSDALRKQDRIYPPMMISLIESGEASGTLDSVTARLADQFEKDSKLKNKVTSAMIYPVVLGTLAVGAVIILITFVLPTFISMFETSDAPLPGPTQMIVGLSDIIRTYWYIILMVIVLLVVGLSIYFRSPTGMRLKDNFKLSFPLTKQATVKICAARFTRAMANLVSAGIPLLTALDITSRVVNNSIIMDKIGSMREDVRTGMTLSMTVKKYNVFPPIVYSMLAIGEESGNLDDVLNKVSDYLDEEVDTSVQRLMSLLEPALMVFMAGAIGFIVVAMILPIFGMYSALQ